MTIPLDSCSCALDSKGRPCGCSSVTIRDTPHGPRFLESPCGPGEAPRRDGARFDAREAGAPAGSLTKELPRGFHVDAWGTLTRAPTSERFDPTRAGAPLGALTR